MMPQQYVAQPGYWPNAEPVYVVGPHDLIINQVHYYLSPENLYRDDFLRSQMDPQEGWLTIQLLATFNRLRSISPDPNVIAEALKLSPELEVHGGRVRKRHDWQRWLPHAQA